MPAAETLDERRARLRNGRWNVIDSRPANALVTYDRWGHKRPATVYRSQVSRWDGTKFLFDGCKHNHLKRNAADQCAARMVRALNTEGDK